MAWRFPVCVDVRCDGEMLGAAVQRPSADIDLEHSLYLVISSIASPAPAAAQENLFYTLHILQHSGEFLEQRK